MEKNKEQWDKLYTFQEEVLESFSQIKQSVSTIYFGGGTALARFYLNHRLSEDLDFFADNIFQFYQESLLISRQIQAKYKTSENLPKEESEDYSFFYIEKDDIALKIEIQNYFENRVGKIHTLRNGLKIDNLENILSNKLTTFCNRNEPKDLFDIICIANNFCFDWSCILQASSKKQLETDEYAGKKENVVKSIYNFNYDRLEKFLNSYYCLDKKNNFNELKKKAFTLRDDLNKEQWNSLSQSSILIEDAKPHLLH
ncbi:nucleotidyl transferase AbiEii/AbiGii toxin family protein [Arcobacter sp.]|uniref:nucleotidyl transferase AbiEii/AbiGii toxin family protein n=1 Tax=Arcobacter sp. TaxID=1872629 RepID=UPI003D0B3F2F